MSEDEAVQPEPSAVSLVAAQGGRARAEKLTPEERSEIARIAAHHRWDGGKDVPRATHEGTLKIADAILPVAVLEGGVRVITSAALLTALGRPWRGRYRRTNLPNFLDSKTLIPFISKDLLDVLAPVEYVGLGGRRHSGYRAELLPLVCDVYLTGRLQDKLTPRQMTIAKQAEIVVRSLSKIGIVALVDEATGYQEVRDRRALQAILDRYLTAELAAWTKRFPDEFYDEIFRLRGWTWKRKGSGRPVQTAKDTINLVYMRMLPDLLKELEVKNPKDERGRRKAKHHQFFSVDIGSPALNAHVHAVITLMKAFDTWDEFKERLDRSLPVVTRLSDLPLFNQPIVTIEPSPRDARSLPALQPSAS
jgi:hypothetical protein